jgi:hypothetical protein
VEASAPTHQLLATGGESLLLGPLHRHRADLQLRRGGSQGCGLDCRQLLHQLLHCRLQPEPDPAGCHRCDPHLPHVFLGREDELEMTFEEAQLQQRWQCSTTMTLSA